MIETGIIKLDQLLNGGIRNGSNILLIGPPMSGKEVILNQIMYHGAVKNENAVITVNTYEPCITKMMGGKADEDEIKKIAYSPVDLTFIGIKISQFFEKFFMINNEKNIQLSINSLSTFLMYSNIKTVFRFLHVFTGRIKDAGGLGIYVLNSGAHDMVSIASLNQLFDGRIEVKSENDSNYIRVMGLSPKPTTWLEYEIDGAEVKIG